MIWTQDKPSFNGKYYTIKEAMTEPKPIQKPHPPIIVGSVKAGKLMCRVAAKYANSFNFFDRNTFWGI
jgi:alkanesulfonate monooxygenase SsuD/methylene tetrahydromethanopterin reductase-like flavin-dependent oxidoreductase (luciferase family)